MNILVSIAAKRWLCIPLVVGTILAVAAAQHLLVKEEGGVMTLVMNRPEARNALSPQMLVQLCEAWHAFRDRDDLRVAILTGAGDTDFCAGGDLKLTMPLMTGARAPEDEWDHLFQTNLRSMVMAAQAAVPYMERAGGGSIINLSSIAAVRAYPATSTAYTASKAGAIGLTVALAGQLGDRRIRVNAIAAGQVYTPLTAARMTPEDRKARATMAIIKEEGTAWDIGWTSVFLASDESRWITGQTIHVDGGISIQIPGGQTRAP